MLAERAQHLVKQVRSFLTATEETSLSLYAAEAPLHISKLETLPDIIVNKFAPTKPTTRLPRLLTNGLFFY